MRPEHGLKTRLYVEPASERGSRELQVDPRMISRGDQLGSEHFNRQQGGALRSEADKKVRFLKSLKH